MFGYEAYTNDNFSELLSPTIKYSLAWVDCIVTDTTRLADTIRGKIDQRKEPGKITACCYTVPSHLAPVTINVGNCHANKRKVLWASRFVDSKRPDILAAVAANMPEVEFLAYGSTDSERQGAGQMHFQMLQKLPNIDCRGSYQNFADIDKSEVAAFLYTSDSDGIPMVLLEAATCEIPIVAPYIGGISEFLTNDCGWLIDQFDDVDGYCQALMEILADSDGARIKTEQAKMVLSRQHSPSARSQRLQLFSRYF